MFLDNAGGTETTFWMCAIIGTAFFGIRLLLILVGFGGDHSEVGHHGGDLSAALDADTSFSLVSINSASSFLAMFGWAGLACYVQFEMGVLLSILIAAGVGFFTMLVTAYLFHLIYKFTNVGEVFDSSQAVGEVATVYQRIPADGAGVIQVTVNGLTRELSAVGEQGAEIDSFAKVSVVKTVDRSTVVVKPV